MWCTCTPGFGYPGCRAALVGNLRRRLPSACSIGELRQLLPSVSSISELHQRAPLASSVSELCQRALPASSVGCCRRPVPSACAVGPALSACAVGLRRRPAPSAYADSRVPSPPRSTDAILSHRSIDQDRVSATSASHGMCQQLAQYAAPAHFAAALQLLAELRLYSRRLVVHQPLPELPAASAA